MGTRREERREGGRFYEELARFAGEYNRGPTTREVATWVARCEGREVDRRAVREQRARLRRLKTRGYIAARDRWYGGTAFKVWVVPLWRPRNVLLWLLVRLGRLVRRAWARVKGLVGRGKKK